MMNAASQIYSLQHLKAYVEVCRGMLVFKDEAAFRQVVDFLHFAVEKVSSCNLNLGDYDEYDYVLEHFENMLGHYSLRRRIQSEYTKLITSNQLTPDNDPDDYYFADKIIRSFVNTNLELAIGKKKFSLTEYQGMYKALKKGKYTNMGSYQVHDGFHDSNSGTTLKSKNATRFSGWLEIKGVRMFQTGSSYLKYNFDISNIGIDEYCELAGILKYDWFIYKPPSTTPIHTVPDTGERITYQFPGPGTYKICVQAYNQYCKSNLYCDYLTINEPPDLEPEDCCTPYSRQERSANYSSRRQMRVRLLLMTFQPVLPYTSITTSTRAFKKGPLGLVWLPHKVSFISVSMDGFYNELWCKGPYKTLPGYSNSKTNRTFVTSTHYSFASIFVHKQSIKSKHSITNSGLISNANLAICPA